MKKKKKKKMPFSDLPVAAKFFLLDFLLLLAFVMVFAAMMRTISAAQEEKYAETERTVITSSEQIMDMAVDSAVAIAKTIYSNESIYNFLNRKYSSSSDYYEAYYPIQQNSTLKIAETNVVKGCTIYTDNPTILAGGNIKQLEPARNDYWYKLFKKLNKPTVLCIDPDKLTITLIRKLDYISLDTGESYLCMDINKNALAKNFENLKFDGDLYLMSGGTLIYSSSEESYAQDVLITTEFDCITKNYYSADIEYYSRANRNNFREFIIVNKFLMIPLAIILLILITVSLLMSRSIKRRIRYAEEDFNKTGNTASLYKGANGKDEIGSLLDICCSMSERLQLKGSEYQLSSDIIQQKSSDYDTLFSTAMRLDAELFLMNSHPDLVNDMTEESISLSLELSELKKLAEKENVTVKGSISDADEIYVPAYSIVLIADDIFRTYNASSVELSHQGDTAIISFSGDSTPKSSDTLKLHAIFEEDGISNEYSFDRNSRFNPYLRFKHCLGSNGDMEISDKDKLKITMKIKKN